MTNLSNAIASAVNKVAAALSALQGYGLQKQQGDTSRPRRQLSGQIQSLNDSLDELEKPASPKLANNWKTCSLRSRAQLPHCASTGAAAGYGSSPSAGRAV